MMKKILALVFASILFSLSLATVQAAAGNDGAYGQPCPGGYGQNECFTNIVVDKKVQNPKTSSLVDHLGANDDRFSPKATIKFQIKVTNTGNLSLSNIEVKDVLPPYLEGIKGFGNFDANTREMKMTIDKLEPNQTRTLNIEAKILDASKLPTDQSILCTINQVTARSEGNMAEDNAGFCIQLKAMQVQAPPPVKQTPPTGPGTLALVGLIPTALTGIYLRRKIKLVK